AVLKKLFFIMCPSPKNAKPVAEKAQKICHFPFVMSHLSFVGNEKWKMTDDKWKMPGCMDRMGAP
ncbi:MAG TPA: hypothetical protein VHH35_03475, partial [Pyrinomonadaceae bacterium]|nr:hypothetical protein [Pyrinomonadaceae bacterium]